MLRGVGYGYINNGNKALPDGSNPSYGASWAIDDVMGIALDLDNNQVNFYKNNAAQGVISIDDGYSYVMSCGHGQSGVTATFDANFGQRSFTYTPPTVEAPDPVVTVKFAFLKSLSLLVSVKNELKIHQLLVGLSSTTSLTTTSCGEK